MVASYVPERGDIVWLNFNPQAGHEQAGRRPAFILSPRAYNQKTSLALCCPITSKQKGYPFEVVIPENDKATGVILADQVRNLDWKEYDASFLTSLAQDIYDDVVAKLSSLFD